MSPRHIIGLIITAVLALALYWFWQDGHGLVQQQLRPWPMLRTAWGEFGLMIVFLVTCLLLGGAQWVWDKFPNPSGEDDHG